MAEKNKKSKSSREQQEVDKAYFDLTGRNPSEGLTRSAKTVIAISAVLMLIAISIVIFALISSAFTYGRVKAGNVNLEGMTKKEAQAALNNLAMAYENTDMTIVVMNEIIVLDTNQVVDKLNVSQILTDAKKAGEGPVELDILNYLSVDENAIWQALLPLETKYGVTPSKTQWQITGSDPDPNVPDDAGSKRLIIQMGVPDYGLDTQKLFQMIQQSYRKATFQVRMDCDVVLPERPDLQEIYQLICTDACDAVLDESTFQITPESKGYGFDLELATNLLASCKYGDKLEIPFTIKNPTVTAQQLEAQLYADTLGEYKTPHTSDDDRNQNLRLACEAINGTILLPGETFSYNDTLGERTEEKGYKPAASYVNGLTVDTIGGGICQVSSTLYYSCLLSDMEIVRRSPHGYVSNYIPKGMDAAVSWKSQDFKFKNNLTTPIRIEAWMDGGYVYVRILGIETRSYYVEMYYKELESVPYDVVYQYFPPDNEKGYADGDVIITPYTGCTVKSYKKLIDRETGKTIENKYETTTTYQKRDKVICLIEVPTTPAPTIPETTLEPTQETTPEPTQGPAPTTTTEAAPVESTP